MKGGLFTAQNITVSEQKTDLSITPENLIGTMLESSRYFGVNSFEYPNQIFGESVEIQNTYKKSNIPPNVYKHIFPNSDSGKYNQIYSFNEAKDHFQLILISKGKMHPELYLITCKKSNLEIVDEMLIFKYFKTQSDTNIVQSKFSPDLSTVVLTEIKTGGNSTLDTIETRYSIQDNGTIKKAS